MATAQYQNLNSSSAKASADITPSDSATFRITQGLYIKTAGTLTVHFVNDASGTNRDLGSVPGNVIYPFSVDMVLATGTTADVVALYN